MNYSVTNDFSIKRMQYVRSKMPFLVYFIAFACLIVPQSYALPRTAFVVWRAASIAVALLALIQFLRTEKLNAGFLSISAMYVTCLVVAPVLQNSQTDMETNCYLALRAVGFVALLFYGMSHDERSVLGAFAAAGTILLAVHLLSVFLYWNVVGGMRSGYIEHALGYTSETRQHWYFLTYDNASVFFFYPIITCCLVYGCKYKERIASIAGFVSLAVVLITFVLQEAITAAFSGLLFAAMVVLYSTSHEAELSYSNSCVLGCGFVMVLVVVVVYSTQLSDFASFFGKSADFSKRGLFWSQSLYAISQNPIIGNGYESAALAYPKIGQSHCHNLVIEVLYEGGIVSLLLFFAFLYSCRPSISSDKHLVSLISAGILAFFVAAGVDWLISNPLPLALFIMSMSCTSQDDRPAQKSASLVEVANLADFHVNRRPAS